MAETMDQFNMEELLLHIMDSNSQFGETIKAKVSAVVDTASNKLVREMSQLKVSPKEISLSTMVGLNEKDLEKNKKKYKDTSNKLVNSFSKLKIPTDQLNINTIMGLSKQEIYNKKRAFSKTSNRLMREFDKLKISTKDFGINSIMGLTKQEITKNKRSFISASNNILNQFSKLKMDTGALNIQSMMGLDKSDIEKTRQSVLSKINKNIDSSILESAESGVSAKEESKQQPSSQFQDKTNDVTVAGFSKNALDALGDLFGSAELKAQAATSVGSIGGLKLESADSGILSEIGKGMLLTALPSGVGAMLGASGAAGAGAALKGAGIPLLIASTLLWFAMDGIRGWFAAEEGEKTAGTIGTMLGGVGEGPINAAFNGLKWAGLGVIAGSSFGPVGMVIGGIVGLALGAILGWIGGDRIKTFISDITDWANNKLDAFLDKHPVLKELLRSETEEEKKAANAKLVMEESEKRITSSFSDNTPYGTKKPFRGIIKKYLSGKDLNESEMNVLAEAFRNLPEEQKKKLRGDFSRYQSASGKTLQNIPKIPSPANQEDTGKMWSKYFNEYLAQTEKQRLVNGQLLTTAPTDWDQSNDPLNIARKLQDGTQPAQSQEKYEIPLEKLGIPTKPTKDDPYQLLLKYAKENEINIVRNLMDGRRLSKDHQNVIRGIWKRINDDKEQPRIKMADGGIVTEPTRALIGEAGPEAVVPLDQYNNTSDLQKDMQTQFVEMKKIYKKMIDRFDTLIEVNVSTAQILNQSNSPLKANDVDTPMPTNVVSSKPRITDADILRQHMLNQTYGVI